MSRIKRLLCLISLMLFCMTASPANAAEMDCMRCHGQKDISAKGASLYIDPAKYTRTTHAQTGCTSCHDKVTKGHPADGIRPSKAGCQECHGAVFEEYGKSPHANMAGCTDCHNPHAVKSFLSVSGRDINTQCYKCHDHHGIIASHAKWLPQAKLHVDAMPCVACHTSSENYVIILHIAKREAGYALSDFTLASYDDLKKILPAGKEIEQIIDLDGDNSISLAELKKFNTGRLSKNYRLLGTMMPEVITHNYQTLDSRWDCTFCHASGPKALQTSYLAFPEQEGTYKRVGVERGAILDMLYGTPDFYILGTTRSATLSIIGALIAAGGLMVPIVHGTIRVLTRKKRKETA